MESMDCYVTVVQLLALLAVNDFDAQLPNKGNNYWRGPNKTLISAHGITPHSRLPQKILMWALARIMHLFVIEGFAGGVWQLELQGRRVGAIIFVQGDVGPSISSSFARVLGEVPTNMTIKALQPTVMDQTVTNNDLTWTYEFTGDPMTAADVCMGTIGSLIFVAQRNYEDINDFVGSFPPRFKAISAYQSIVQPSRLNKKIIIQTMMNMVDRANSQNDWRPQSTKISDRGGLFAKGLYVDTPVPSSNSITVS